MLSLEGVHQPAWPSGRGTVVVVTIHVDGPCVQVGKGLVPLGIHSRGRYAMRRGIPRCLEMLGRVGVPATFFACGHDVEHYPQIYRDIHAAGHEIAAHGYMHEGWDLGETEPELLEKTHRTITDVIGVAPVGWCSPSGRKSSLTLPTLRRLGYYYDCSEKDDDLPYVMSGDGEKPFVMLPNNTVSLDDYPMYQFGQSLASEVLQNWIEEFEAIRDADGYLHLTLHPIAGAGSGPPARAKAVERFLKHLAAQPDVSFLSCRDLADHCLANEAALKARRP
ncbi:polysaccharide deacetylase family protein [Microvirga sp. VF16]|uniref:polysaccharide deacetylase family protein n=1 Tax=Microvirga sp. VF16 TaxID=2807101 RepID=UPI00193D24B3|nr:polysaccharide deacetylase family protein [Microvirga sp. VF16]QRM34276.1 polysaccharide deacetylase family protein [Microvirga sp. VF16]